MGGLGILILNGYLALLLGVQRRRSGCHSFMPLSVNTSLSRSHWRCAVLYLTALLSPWVENSSKSTILFIFSFSAVYCGTPYPHTNGWGQMSWMVYTWSCHNRYITIALVKNCASLKISKGMMNVPSGHLNSWVKLYRIIQVGISEMWLLTLVVNATKEPLKTCCSIYSTGLMSPWVKNWWNFTTFNIQFQCCVHRTVEPYYYGH